MLSVSNIKVGLIKLLFYEYSILKMFLTIFIRCYVYTEHEYSTYSNDSSDQKHYQFTI